MNISKEIERLVDDVVGTIILIVEDEGDFSECIIEFIEMNQDIFFKSNNLTMNIQDIKNKDIEEHIIIKLRQEGYMVESKNKELCVRKNG